jgi:hypothetical protein
MKIPRIARVNQQQVESCSSCDVAKAETTAVQARLDRVQREHADNVADLSNRIIAERTHSEAHEKELKQQIADASSREKNLRQQLTDFAKERDDLTLKCESMSETLRQTQTMLQAIQRSADAGAHNRNAELSKDLEWTKRELDNARKKVGDQMTAVNDLQLQLDVRTESLDARTRDRNDAYKDINQLNAQVASLKQDIAAARADQTSAANLIDLWEQRAYKARASKNEWKTGYRALQDEVAKLRAQVTGQHSDRIMHPPHVNGPANYYTNPADTSRDLSNQAYVPRDHRPLGEPSTSYSSRSVNGSGVKVKKYDGQDSSEYSFDQWRMAVLSALQDGVWTLEAAKISFIRNHVTGVAFDIVAERADPDPTYNTNPYMTHTEILQDLTQSFGTGEKARLAQSKLFAESAYQTADESYTQFLARFNASFRCLRMDEATTLMHIKRLMKPELSRNAVNAGVTDANLQAFHNRVRRIEADRQYFKEQDRFRPTASATRRHEQETRYRTSRDRPRDRDRDNNRDRDKNRGDRGKKQDNRGEYDRSSRLDEVMKKYQRSKDDYSKLRKNKACLACGQLGHRAEVDECPRKGKSPVPSKDIVFCKAATLRDDDDVTESDNNHPSEYETDSSGNDSLLD